VKFWNFIATFSFVWNLWYLMMATVARTSRGKQMMETRMGVSTVEGEAREYYTII
jgi:hypothetical protein